MKRQLFFLAFSFLIAFSQTDAYAEKMDPKPIGLSRSLIQQAWTAFDAKEFDKAMGPIEECIARFDLKAREQQASLKEPIPNNKANQYWELNDVAVAKFIKAKIYIEKNETEKAKQVLNDLIENYPYALAYEPRGGWHWMVADAARRLSADLRGGGLAAVSGSSNVLKKKTYDAYKNGQHALAMSHAEKCIDLYRDSALIQQKQLTKYPEEKHISRYWSLNDVGTCYYLAGLSALAMGDRAKMEKYFQTIKQEFFYASFWDPNGWYSRITDLIAEKEKELQGIN